MWEKFNKLSIINVIALMVVSVCCYITVTSKDRAQQDKFMDMGFGAVIGWAYMKSQQPNKQNQA